MKNTFSLIKIFEECGRVFYNSKGSGISEQIGGISGIFVRNQKF